jgi:hypothetical protein
MRRLFLGLLILTLANTHLWSAQPVITSPPPANGASPSGPFSFTFSQPMNPDFSGVAFIDFTTFATLPTVDVWSAGNTVLTCTPSPAFPTNRQIVWSASGENMAGEPLGGTDGGIFTTGSGSGGGGGSGTNTITTFSVGKVHHYNQTSSGAPTLDPDTPYDFSGVTVLASNRTATNITLTLPTAAVSNLMQLPFTPEIFILYNSSVNLSTYDATFPAGNYTFLVKSLNSNQTMVVNLPTTNSLPLPNAPHVTNYVAAQVVDPSQPFVLGWDAFVGGTAADFIDVDIGTAFGSPNPGLPGALNGTARTLTIPANTLQPNTTYASQIGFFHSLGATNATFATNAFRATYTEFSVVTSSGAAGGQLVLTNAVWSPGVFSFDVLCTNGQTVTIEYTNALRTGAWPKLLTTNSPGTKIHIVSPQAVSNSSLYYRARNGP